MDEIFPSPCSDPRVGGAGAAELRFVPFDTASGRNLYLRCYRDAWQIAHGTLRGFNAAACWQGALGRAAAGTLWEARLDGSFAGILSLDDRMGERMGYGWIAFCWVSPSLRGKGLGRALVEFSAEHCRALGRGALRLTVAPGNPALGFYKKLCFRTVGTEPGALGRLYVMELKL